MQYFNLLQTGLLLHMIGLTILVGATLSGYVTRRQFEKDYKDRQRSVALMSVMSKLGLLAGIGLGLQVVSGIMMMAATGGSFGQQWWFKIKMIIVLLVIVAIVALNRGTQKRLRKLVSDDRIDAGKDRQVAGMVSRIKYLQIFLMGFFVLIFILSVFRFN